MKIGILTYHRAHNYGALLQAYALKTFIARLGHQVDIVDYWPEYHDQDYKLIPNFNSLSFLGKIKSILLLFIGYPKIVKRANGYNQFIKEQFNLSDSPLYRIDDELNKVEYDLIVYGSDQIWRRSNLPLFKGFSDVFWGRFPENVKRKVTYAASMGVIDLEEKDKQYAFRMLKQFDRISVREKELKLLVEDIIGHEVSLVLDPVFLLEREEWLKLNYSSTSICKDKYILFYQLTPSDEAIEFTNRLKKKFRYKVIEIRGRVEPLLFGDRYCQTASPFDFISLIQNAEIVVSTSFHGVAFSLIYEKQFYSLGLQNNSARVQTLLDELGISQRLIMNINQVNYEEIIDYKEVNKIIETFKKLSQNYLIDSIKTF